MSDMDPDVVFRTDIKRIHSQTFSLATLEFRPMIPLQFNPTTSYSRGFSFWHLTPPTLKKESQTENTLPKTNMAPKNRSSQKNISSSNHEF